MAIQVSTIGRNKQSSPRSGRTGCERHFRTGQDPDGSQKHYSRGRDEQESGALTLTRTPAVRP